MVKISILGYGWLGNKLGMLLDRTSYTINGSSTKGSNVHLLHNKFIHPYIIDIADTANKTTYDADFFDCDTLIISLKPSRQKNDHGYFENQINVCTELAKKHKIKQIIFWSSTSVYGDNNQIANEESVLNPTRPSGNRLIKAENMLLNESAFNTKILRLGGLIGYERNPYEVIKNVKQTGSLHIPVNLVHADDVARITELLINKYTNSIYNVVSDIHPLRIDYYKQAFSELGVTHPIFDLNAQHNFKIVDNTKVKKELNYHFLLNNPAEIYDYKPLLTL
ncbi:MAG: NAD-dependent epimerase/dehydratase family protein [Salinivirgaceae bacterium]|jgi:nucleoside-diphosphate-sugar epimerase|nr:NAD-dependent epimerase/dehydratase family protein [Salinivirgaceae bacterium]